MKYLLTFIIFSITLFKINASTVDSTLIKEYQRGYDTVYEIIEHENLKDCIASHPFCCLFYENLWSITVKKEKSYILYYGYRIGNAKVKHKEIPIDNTVMTDLFSLEQNKFKKSIKRRDSYTPIYWYLLRILCIIKSLNGTHILYVTVNIISFFNKFMGNTMCF